jgi:hypothetical protein
MNYKLSIYKITSLCGLLFGKGYPPNQYQHLFCHNVHCAKKIGYQEKKSHNSETIVSAEQDSKTGNTKLTGKQMPSDAKSSLEPLAPAR